MQEREEHRARGEQKLLEQLPKPEVRLSDETLQYLEARFEVAAERAAAAMVQTLTHPANAERLFDAFFAAARKQAVQRTGSFVITSAVDFLKKLFWLAVIVLAIAWLGDWKLAAMVFKALKAGAP